MDSPDRQIRYKATDSEVGRLLSAFDQRQPGSSLTDEEARALAEIGSDEQREAGRLFWSRRAWTEFNAIVELNRCLAEALRSGLSTEEASLFAHIVADESSHTRWCMSVAEALGGYVVEVPKAFPYEAPSAQPVDLPRWLVLSGLVSETLSLALLREQANRVAAPLRRLVRRIAKDETLHVAVAQHFAPRWVPKLPSQERLAIGIEAARLIDESKLAFAGIGARPDEAAIHSAASAAELGGLPRAVASTTLDHIVAEEIRPRLGALGVFVMPRTRTSPSLL